MGRDWRIMRAGFSLVELALSLAIIAIALVTTVASLPAAIDSNKAGAQQRAAAVAADGLINAVIGATPASTNPSEMVARGFIAPVGAESPVLKWVRPMGSAKPVPVKVAVPFDDNGLPDFSYSANGRDPFDAQLTQGAGLVAVVTVQPPAGMRQPGWVSVTMVAPRGRVGSLTEVETGRETMKRFSRIHYAFAYLND
jgi:prepilin-type N-terminal cleavage/methylation domain-containing protein